MKLDTKKILTIGAGAVVGYLIFCKFMKRADEKALEGGATGEEVPTEEGEVGGGGGGGFGGGGGGFGGGGGYVAPLPPVIAPIVVPPAGYVVLPSSNNIVPLSAIQPENTNSVGGQVNTQPTRETPPPPPPPPRPIDVSGAPVVMINKDKFVGYDGNMNQDSIL